jgi:hypothetical protein
MRLYDVAIAALAIGAPQKWVDNLLSHHDVPGVVTARRGVARRIPHSALMQLALARDLHVEIGLSVRDALRLAAELLVADSHTVHEGGHVRVTFDRTGLERVLDARLRDALESAPTPRRGRPRGRVSTTRRQ